MFINFDDPIHATVGGNQIAKMSATVNSLLAMKHKL